MNEALSPTMVLSYTTVSVDARISLKFIFLIVMGYV